LPRLNSIVDDADYPKASEPGYGYQNIGAQRGRRIRIEAGL